MSDCIMVSYNQNGVSGNQCFDDPTKAKKFIEENKHNWSSYSTFTYEPVGGVMPLTPVAL